MDRIAPIAYLVCASALAGCRGHPTTGGAPAPAATTGQAQGPLQAAAQPSGGSRPAPLVRVQAGAEAREQGVAIVVQNHAAELVELAAGVEVERKVGAGFQAFPEKGLALRPEPRPPGCIRLVPGAELRPSPWQGAKTGAPPGTYRFVLRGCDGSYRVDGDPFEL